MEKQIYMTPKQPFFVTSSRSYEKFILNRFGIVHFYHCFTGTEPRYAIPDGCVDMVFCCNPKHPYAEICGTVLSPQIVLSESNTSYFGVRFLPGYNPVLGSADIMSHLVNHRIPLDDLIQDRRMLEGICNTTDFRQQIRVFMRSYEHLSPGLSAGASKPAGAPLFQFDDSLRRQHFHRRAGGGYRLHDQIH